MMTDQTDQVFQDTYEDRRLEAMWALTKAVGVLEDIAEHDGGGDALVAAAVADTLRIVARFLDRLPEDVDLLAAEVAEAPEDEA